jgi:hypothetical protein
MYSMWWPWWVLRLWKLEMWHGWGWWVVVGVRLLERRILPLLLLGKDFDVALELCKSCCLLDNVLPSGFGALSCSLPPCDGFLFLAEPLNLLLESEQLLFCCFIFGGLFLQVLHLDLLELGISLDDLYRRRCPWG